MSRFDGEAKDWDSKPRRILLAENIYKGITQKVELNKDMKVLDIGTGTGLLLMHMIDEVKHITGLDNSIGMLEKLKEKADNLNIKNIDYLVFDADQDQLPKNKFDLAVSSMTFHHFNKPDLFLKELYKSLKQGGKICIGDLDKEDGSFHTDNAKVDVKHFGFEKQVFKTWLENAGFINISINIIFKIEKNERKYPVFLAYAEKK